MFIIILSLVRKNFFLISFGERYLTGYIIIIHFCLAPPTNQSTFNQWTVGAVYYSVLVLAEAFGKSNTSQIVDLTAGNEFTPAYAIYENGQLSKMALFNYVDDLGGTRGPSDLSVTLSVPGAGVPASVKVKYLEAKSVSSKYNISWAGQVSFFLFHELLLGFLYKNSTLFYFYRLLVTNSRWTADLKETSTSLTSPATPEPMNALYPLKPPVSRWCS